MKAVSGKFHPIFQWFYFDSVESLPENLPLPPEEVDLQVGLCSQNGPKPMSLHCQGQAVLLHNFPYRSEFSMRVNDSCSV